jgi:hypothetical protein
VEHVEVTLSTQTVVVKGDASTAELLAAMQAAGRPARVLGQGDADTAGFRQTAQELGCSLANLQVGFWVSSWVTLRARWVTLRAC